MTDRLAPFRKHLDGEYEATIQNRESCRIFAEHSGVERITPRDAVDRAVDAVQHFSEEMLGTGEVQAVAFLASHVPDCPTTLLVEVFTPVIRGDEASRRAVRSVAAAKARMSDVLHPVLPSSLEFVNTASKDVDLLKDEMTRRWHADSTVRLLALVTFKRRAA